MVVRLQGARWCALLAAGLLSCSEQALSPVTQGGIVQSGMVLPAVQVEAPRRARELPPLPEPETRTETFLRGVVLGPLERPDSEAAFKREHTRLLDRAVALGATDVQLTVRWLQTDANAIEIAPYDTVDDELLGWVVDQARRRKLRVLLAPTVGLEAALDKPLGRQLKPSSWERWWWSYRRLVLHYARVAAMRKIGTLSLGSELDAIEGQGERWSKLIKEVRKIYSGRLTYAASAERFTEVAFWDSLDVATIALDQAHPRSELSLVERLEPLARRLESKLGNTGYLLRETGCGADKVEPAKALLCERALFRSFHDQPHLKGVFVPRVLEVPRGDKSAELVRTWYKKSRG